MENTKLSQLDNLVVETTKLSKKEQAITDPKELETLIKKYEDAVSGKIQIKNSKTGEPLSKGYCQDKLRLLKRKMAALNNNITVDGKLGEQNSKLTVDNEKAQETNISVNTDTVADASKSIEQLLVTAGWVKEPNGTFKKENFSDKFSAGISFNIQESKGFEQFAQRLIFEATGDINLTVKVKEKSTGKEDSFTQTFNAEQLKNAKDIEVIINKFIEEKFNANAEEKTSETLTVFFNAWKKLSEEEQDAFIDFYGDKLTTLLQKQG